MLRTFTALRVGRYVVTRAELWLSRQKRYELECARRQMGAVLRSIQPRAA